jgi:hypothetical protein
MMMRRSISEERRIGPMNFQEPEVMEIGEARELIQEIPVSGDQEGPVGFRMKNFEAIYIVAAE